ncbi:MAG: CapA family protein [Prevotella sp.]|nr:CapA family protein [Prevotella sp.]
MKRCSILLAVSLGIAPAPPTPPVGGEIIAATFLACPSPLTGGSGGSTGESEGSTLLFTGDILLDRGVRTVIQHKGADALFSRGIDSLFRTAQVVVGNLECPATKIKSPVQKRYIFRAEPEWLPVLRRHGLTHLNLCNNHSIDQGRRGLTDTRSNVVKAGMVPVGAGQDMEKAARPVLLCSQPRRVWLVPSLRLSLENYAYLPSQPCVSQESMEQLLARIHQLKKADPACVVVVSLHWGGEHTLQPVPRQRLEARRLIRAGADVLVCHHTHTLQTVEEYEGKRIYYSIGNFIFDQHRPLNSRACVVKLSVGKRSLNVETIPVDIRNCVPYLSKQ